MKKRLTILLASLGLIAAGLISVGQISLASATTCITEASQFESGDISYTVLQFKTVDTCQWTVPARVASVEYLIVAGGGGGGGSSSMASGGGGGGQVINGSDTNIVSPLSITVGGGGAGGGTTSGAGETAGKAGFDSSITISSTIVAKGGGGGSGGFVNGAIEVFSKGVTGFNGGGGAAQRDSRLVAPGDRNGGNLGGVARTDDSIAANQQGGGGGGSGAAGSDGSAGGGGGAGLSSNLTGLTLTYGGGGGGATRGTTGAGPGGAGGGGGGGVLGATPDNGIANTGGGGGGAGASSAEAARRPGGSGGSGVVIVRYITPPTITETNGIVMLVDPRSESVAIPYLTVTSGASTRICFDLTTESNSAIALKSFVDKNTNSDAFRMAVTSNDVVVSVGASNALNKITASRANAQALLKRNVSNSESYLRLYRPESGWSEVDGGRVKVRVDYAVDSECSGVSGTEINVEIPIKVLEIATIQKNPVDLSRG